MIGDLTRSEATGFVRGGMLFLEPPHRWRSWDRTIWQRCVFATTPKRIQRQRSAGWRMPLNAVYVGRPTIWGNLFVHPDPAAAVAAYRQLVAPGTKSFRCEPGGLTIAKNAHRNCAHWAYGEFVRREAPQQLRGRDLACWCPLDQPCHADELLKIANAPQCLVRS